MIKGTPQAAVGDPGAVPLLPGHPKLPLSYTWPLSCKGRWKRRGSSAPGGKRRKCQQPEALPVKEEEQSSPATVHPGHLYLTALLVWHCVCDVGWVGVQACLLLKWMN